MRFISPIAAYKHICKHNKFQLLASGLPNEEATGFIAEFKQGDATDHEREIARNTFVFKGTVNDLAGNPIDPTNKVSCFDTTVIKSPELRKEVERILLSHEMHGKDYVVVASPAKQAPWPAYDKLVVQGRRTIELVAEKIAETVSENGYDAESVAAYERENLNRPEVLAKLAELSKSAPEEELIAA